MRSLIKRHPGLFIGTGIFIAIFLMCYGAILILNNYSRINNMLWKWNEPEKYYMKSHYYEGCSTRTWESIWENDKLVSIKSNDIPINDLCKERDLDISEWSMDYVFDVVVENCGKGTVFCEVEYDPRYHYPSKVNSLYQYTFEMKIVVCDIDKSNCP